MKKLIVSATLKILFRRSDKAAQVEKLASVFEITISAENASDPLKQMAEIEYLSHLKGIDLARSWLNIPTGPFGLSYTALESVSTNVISFKNPDIYKDITK